MQFIMLMKSFCEKCCFYDLSLKDDYPQGLLLCEEIKGETCRCRMKTLLHRPKRQEMC